MPAREDDAQAIGPQHRCPYCDADNFASSFKCRVCGYALRFSSPRVRCPTCRAQHSSALLVCTRCGGDLRPSFRPRPWLIPALTAIAVMIILWRGG